MDSPIKPTDASRAFLVTLDGTHALVDAASERLLVLNDTAATLWRDLVDGRAPTTREGTDFAARLVELGFLARVPEGEGTPEAGGPPPTILAEAPLQVAAGTSDPNPFSSDAIW
jgi:hypothetical protein